VGVTLDDLRIFVAVCRAGSLSAVARQLECTQSAVSQHVKRLEREIGVSLVERHPRGVVPTRAGRLLHTAAAKGMAELDLALRQLAELAQGDAGFVRVTTGATTVRHFMSEAVITFRRRYPQVSLEFQTETSSRNCCSVLATNDVDLAWITIGEPVQGIEQHAVIDLPWVLAIPAHDQLAARSHIEPDDLTAIQHIRLPENSTSRTHLDTAFAELGVKITSDTSVADWDTAILLAELGLGHAVVPALPGWNQLSHPNLHFMPIPALPPLTAGWAVRRWHDLTPLARAFADTVARTCKEGV
jgi:DNA-binding transcriptional LysR family regulator